MKRLAYAVGAVLFGGLFSGAVVVAGTPPPAAEAPKGLTIAEIKITGDELLLIQNNTDQQIDDLNSYWLYSFNNPNPLAATSTDSQQLPDVTLQKGQELLLSATTRPKCGAVAASKLNVSFGDSGGYLELLRLGMRDDGVLTQSINDTVSWSSSTLGDIQNVSSGKDKSIYNGNGLYYRYQKSSGVYDWQNAGIDTTNQCNLVVKVADTSPVVEKKTVLSSSDTIDIPSTIISIQKTVSLDGEAGIPAADAGLRVPVITELLPNVAKPGTDAEDEFIELYNPNDRPFDLTGFKLQVGLTTKHTKAFASGTVLKPKSFTAVFSADSGLSLSNSGGQAFLLDPFDKVISQTDPYSKTADGLAWALADGKWYWTSKPTPGASNVIVAGGSETDSGSVKGVSITTTNAKTSGGSSGSGPTTSSISDAKNAAQTTPIHPGVLAAVIGFALLYAVYEYRHDVHNTIHQLKQYRAARRNNRAKLARRGSN